MTYKLKLDRKKYISLPYYIDACAWELDEDGELVREYMYERELMMKDGIVEIIPDSHAGYVTLVFDTEENALKFQLTYL